jgi:hypothetical protein
MRKLAAIIITNLCLSGSAIATDITFELKVHYFGPSDQAFQDIYGGGLMYGAEINIRAWESLDLWFGGNYFSKTGELTFTDEETELKLFTIGGGVKYRILSRIFALYVGLGLNYYQFKESNPIGEVSDGKLGLVGKIGSDITISGGLAVDLYVKYASCKIQPADFEIDIGGIMAGVGLGYKFLKSISPPSVQAPSRVAA